MTTLTHTQYGTRWYFDALATVVRVTRAGTNSLHTQSWPKAKARAYYRDLLSRGYTVA